MEDISQQDSKNTSRNYKLDKLGFKEQKIQKQESVNTKVSTQELLEICKYYNDLKAKLWNSTRWLSKVLVLFFVLSGAISEICAVFSSSLHCGEILTSNMVVSQAICATTIAIIELGLIFLYAWDTKPLKRMISETMHKVDLKPEKLANLLDKNIKHKQDK